MKGKIVLPYSVADFEAFKEVFIKSVAMAAGAPFA